MAAETTGSADIVIRVMMELKNAEKKLKTFSKRLKSNAAVGAHSMKALDKQIRAVEKSQKRLAFFTKVSTPMFQGWALSIMFFGMALQRIFSQVWKSSTKVFKDVMASVEGTVTAFDELDGSLKFLGFVVGQALEPLAAMLIPFIIQFADLVSENEELTRSITKWGLILGTIFTVGGAGALAIFGFIELAGKIATAQAKMGLLKGDIKALGTTIRSGLGTLTILWALKQSVDAYKDFEDDKWIKGTIKALSAGAAAYGGVRLLQNKKGGATLIAIGVGLELIYQGKFFQAIGLLVAPLMALGGMLADAISFEFNKVLKEGLKEGLLDALEALLVLFSGPYFMGVRGIIRGMMDNLRGMFNVDTDNRFDWFESFSRHLGEFRNDMRGLDIDLNDILDRADRAFVESQVRISQADIQTGYNTEQLNPNQLLILLRAAEREEGILSEEGIELLRELIEVFRKQGRVGDININNIDPAVLEALLEEIARIT